ncbi:exo-alpha-sialidase [Aridibaculum aurantiacum]|uniref:exo-alpha-sialidase n=1 Tax=Aridibaculum aurantiacum TaxID=2810307 RepID=UPI001F604ADB|nr:exo-alpha-sialidase [Aridibaculum aurantiacum]
MKNWLNKIAGIGMCVGAMASANAQDTVRYTGNTLVNVDYHHGQLSPAVGVHNIQIFRANREHPELAEGFGWTYNHAPMIAYWNNTFYVEYLSNPRGEHVPPGQTFILSSKDGYNWTKPVVAFPVYKIPDGTTKEGRPEVAKDMYSVNHQRMGFHVSKKNRLLAFAYYGLIVGVKDDPNDGLGIGRVVREIYKDGSFGPIYFIRYNKKFNEKNTQYPFYTKSKDKGFIEACNEVLANPLITQQWNEEADRDDPLIPLKKEYKAFSFYHLNDGRVVGLWKNALTAISNDNGKSWPTNATRAPGFVNSNAKIWGQRTSDGKFMTVYNPSEFRWPLALSVSDNGLDYKNLLLVHGEISPIRYGGEYKSYGPQYVRGIVAGNGTPPDGKAWVTYSMNKEDMWVSSIPVPVKDKVNEHPNEVFDQMPQGKELELWNIYSLQWAPTRIEKAADGKRALVLRDWDRYDFAKAERVVPASKRLVAEFTVIPQQNKNGTLHIEFQNAKGNAGVRLMLDTAGNLMTKAGYRDRRLTTYNANEPLNIHIELNTATRFYSTTVNGKNVPAGLFFAPLDSIERVVFRTGEVRRFPDADTPTDPMHDKLPNAGEKDQEAAYYITSFKTSSK